ncbi:MAG: hypothetical protein LBG70_00625, partial [Bifidobacteriaceae bacterium]|nr:hypothetical protein [Bifidobacteriaceae bacterium]
MTLTIRQLKIFALACLIPLTLVGCSGGPTDPNSASEPAAASAPPAVSDAAEEPVAPEPESSPAPQSSAGPVVPVEALKGPTGMGMAKLIADQAEATVPQFAINLRGTADEIAPEMIRGDLPIAAVPVNLAAVLNNKSEGKLKLAAINTLGVLYVVAKNQKVAQLSDLAGQTVYSTGKGTTPEYVFKYLLEQAGLTDKVKVEFLSEASEVAAHLTADDQAVAVLPEPYVTTVTKQDPSITIALDLSEAWQSAAGVPLVTGALVVNSEWAAAEP